MEKGFGRRSVCRCPFFCAEMDGSRMKSAIVREIGSFEHCDVETPSPQQDEVLVKVSVAGLCRTDVKMIDVGHRDLTLPRIPAEEVVGTICETGYRTLPFFYFEGTATA